MAKTLLIVPAPAWPKTTLYSVRCPTWGFRISGRSREAVDEGALEHYFYTMQQRELRQPHGTIRR